MIFRIHSCTPFRGSLCILFKYKINKVNTKQLKELSAKNPEIEKLDELLKNLDNHPEVKERIERLLEEEKLYIAMVQGNVKKIKELFRIYFTL